MMLKMLLPLAAVAIFAHQSHAASSGDVGLCDAMSERFGCRTGFINNDRTRCRDADQIMDWVTAPTRVNKYRVRSGDGADETSDSDGYNPGTVISIFVSVTDYDWKYRGLLLHAEDENNQTVGSWEYPGDSSPIFWTPVQCPGRLLHTNADPKPFHVEFKWLAPPEGTGTVRFRSLFKRGPANVGEFHHGNEDGDLTLRELQIHEPRTGTTSVDVTNPIWTMSEVGESCDMACFRMSTQVPTDAPTMAISRPTMAPTGSPTMARRTVHNVSWGFDVSTASITIMAGDTVVWWFDQGQIPHDVVSGMRSTPNAGVMFRSELMRDGSFNYTFTEAGQYTYFCEPHLSMFATITVVGDDYTAAPTSAPTLQPSTVFYCDGAAISNVQRIDPPADSIFPHGSVFNPASKFHDGAGLAYPCPTPILSSCSPIAPAVNNETGNCMLRNADCLEDVNASCNGNTAATECGTLAAGFARFCACRPVHPWETASVDIPGRFRRSEFAAHNDAFGTRSNPLITVLSIFSALHFTSRASYRNTLAVVGIASVLGALMPSTDAHNWQFSPARARREASTTAPCRARKKGDTHAQVGPGQDFAVQWATGHSRPSYWVIVHEDNYGWLSHKDFKSMVREYIDEAPAGSNSATNPQFQRYHAVSANRLAEFEAHKVTEEGLDIYGDRIDVTDPNWLNHTYSIPTNLFYFKQEVVERDARISYRSEKYPWLEAAYRYEHETHRPVDFDTVRVTIPGFSGPGHYIVHWWWNGYYDCTDVDYFDTPVPEEVKYGVDLGSFEWGKIDHCQYIEPTNILSGCHDATESAEVCREAVDAIPIANRDVFDPYGINVVPVVNPNNVAFPDVVNIPFNNRSCSSSGWTTLNGRDVTSEQVNQQDVGTARSQSCASNFIANIQNRRLQYSLANVTLAVAVKKCTSDACVGIAWDGNLSANVFTGRHTFWLCTGWDTTSRPGHMAFQKQSASVAIPSTTLRANQQFDVIVDFHKNTTMIELENNQILRDHGLVYAQRGSYSYGWSCELNGATLKQRGPRNGPAYVNNTVVDQFYRSMCPDNKPPVWEIQVPNGIYNITTTHNLLAEASTRVQCPVENVQLSTSTFFSTSSSYILTKTVEVKDGRFTLSEDVMPNNVYCGLLNRIQVTRISASQLGAVWFPGSPARGAYWYRELPKREPIGLVSVQIDRPARNQYDCSFWWMFDGNKCNPGRAQGVFQHADSQGFVLSVADQPCNANGCPGGNVCSIYNKVPFVSTPRDNLYTIDLDCGGVAGRYVRIHLPGSNRIFPVMNIEVHRSTPENATNMTYACYGVHARPKLDTAPEYIITDDPNDPVFYSTCYERTRKFEFLPVPSINVANPPRWRYNGKCITCDSYISNQDPELTNMTTMLTPKWEVSEHECVDCSLSPAGTDLGNVNVALVCASTTEEAGSSSGTIAATLIIILLALGGIMAATIVYRKKKGLPLMPPPLRTNWATNYKRHRSRPGTTNNPMYEQSMDNSMNATVVASPPTRDLPNRPVPNRPAPPSRSTPAIPSKPVVAAKPTVAPKPNIAPKPMKKAPPAVPPKPHIATSWEALVDDASGKVYFINEVGVSQWESPFSGWSADVDDESGGVYYTNLTTGTTQWEMPNSMGASEI